MLREKIPKKRGGYHIVDERLLRELGIIIPAKADKDVVERLLQLVKKATSQNSSDELDREINRLVKELCNVERGGPKTTLDPFIN